MTDIDFVRDAYQKKEITTIRYIESENHPADALTKVKKCPALSKIVTQKKCDLPIEQFVICD